MAEKRIELSGDLVSLRDAFKDVLREAGFIIAEENILSDRFSVVGVNKKRKSLMVTTLISLFWGYIPEKRTAMELVAFGKEGILNATLRCVPYIDTVDMEMKAETTKEKEKCQQLVRIFLDRIVEKLSQSS